MDVRWVWSYLVVLVLSVAAQPLLGQAVEAEPGGVVVYAADFSRSADRSWSRRDCAAVPAGNLSFLGPLANESVDLDLEGLPEHEALRISFDLIVFGTWDGNAHEAWTRGRVGPDLWALEVDGGPVLLRGTFSTLPERPGYFKPHCNLQTWPWPIPSRPLQMGTGGQINTLGFIHTFNDGNSFQADGRYPVSVLVPHRDSKIRLRFSGIGLQAGQDENWGLANVRVEALPVLRPPAARALERAWTALLGDDPIEAFEGFWTLTQGGEETIALLEREVQSFQVDPAAARELIERLRTERDPDAQRAALMAVAAMGPPVEPMLREALSANRTERALAWDALREMEIRELQSPLRRRAAAAARVLQVINSDAARALHQRLLEAPPVQPAPGTPAYDAEWRERFDQLYTLAPGEYLKLIPHPPAAERQQFLAEYQRRQRRNIARDAAAPLRWTILRSQVVPDYLVQISSAPPGRGLAAILSRLNISGPPSSTSHEPIQGAEAFDDLALHGDWLIRFDAAQADLLADLERIVQTQTGRKIRFERGTVAVPTINVSGTYTYAPIDAFDDGIILLFTEKTPPAGGGQAGEGTIEQFLRYRLPYATGRHVIIEGMTNADAPARWEIFASASTQPHRENHAEHLGVLLRHLTQQTGLRFAISDWHREGYRVVEGP